MHLGIAHVHSRTNSYPSYKLCQGQGFKMRRVQMLACLAFKTMAICDGVRLCKFQFYSNPARNTIRAAIKTRLCTTAWKVPPWKPAPPSRKGRPYKLQYRAWITHHSVLSERRQLSLTTPETMEPLTQRYLTWFLKLTAAARRTAVSVVGVATSCMGGCGSVRLSAHAVHRSVR